LKVMATESETSNDCYGVIIFPPLGQNFYPMKYKLYLTEAKPISSGLFITFFQKLMKKISQ